MASILRLDAAGTVIFVAPDNLEHEMVPGTSVNCDRKRLSVKLSTNDGQSWAVNHDNVGGRSGGNW